MSRHIIEYPNGDTFEVMLVDYRQTTKHRKRCRICCALMRDGERMAIVTQVKGAPRHMLRGFVHASCVEQSACENGWYQCVRDVLDGKGEKR